MLLNVGVGISVVMCICCCFSLCIVYLHVTVCSTLGLLDLAMLGLLVWCLVWFCLCSFRFGLFACWLVYCSYCSFGLIAL